MGEQTDQRLPKALIVDDEKEVADAYALRLRDLCAVDTVYDGNEALSAVEDREVDVVLLDRHMPGMSGDEVLATLDERGFDGRVVMVTAIDPGFDVLDMPFDDYLCKPVEREDVRAAVDQQCTTLGYETLGAYFSHEATCRVIESQLPSHRLDDHGDYQETKARTRRLKRRAYRLLDDADELLERFDTVRREGT
jgi:DNA-binding response OmpR family regulator